MMKDGSKSKCGSSFHQAMKEKAKNWVDELHGIFTCLQHARKESRANDILILEEQVHQLLREWKAELNEPTPASSLNDGNLGLFPEELSQLLQQIEEQDDATSGLAMAAVAPLKTELLPHNLNESSYPSFEEKCFDDNQPQEHAFESFNQFECSASTLYNNAVNKSDMITQLDLHRYGLSQDFDNTVGHNSDLIAQFDLCQDYNCNTQIKKSDATQFSLCEHCDYGPFVVAHDPQQGGEDTKSNIVPYIRPPPSAFLGPKCALWDCFRPALGIKSCQDYCSSCHETLAYNEAFPGLTPILRPMGIGVKDGPLFDALNAKTQGKEVGIPKCEGAASTKSPWNAPELFDLSFLKGETVREWLFFDEPRRAFESGTRKQRSLPDYSGRGWHESRKQVIKEHGGLKRSYYMDPQPQGDREWHLYEYKISNHEGCALYRLELKLVDGKKSPKGKVTKESLADLQKKMGRLTADVPKDDQDPKTKAQSENHRSPKNEMNIPRGDSSK